jgi:hypothetical protein
MHVQVAKCHCWMNCYKPDSLEGRKVCVTIDHLKIYLIKEVCGLNIYRRWRNVTVSRCCGSNCHYVRTCQSNWTITRTKRGEGLNVTASQSGYFCPLDLCMTIVKILLETDYFGNIIWRWHDMFLYVVCLLVFIDFTLLTYPQKLKKER